MARAGDVVLLPFPFTDLSAAKKRPVLLLSDEDSLGDFLAVAVTSKAGYQSAIPLRQGDLQAAPGGAERAGRGLVMISSIRPTRPNPFRLSFVWQPSGDWHKLCPPAQPT